VSLRPCHASSPYNKHTQTLQIPGVKQTTNKQTNKHTHTHTRAFNSPFSGTTRVSRYQKGKINLDFTEAKDSEWQWHQLGICKSAPCSDWFYLSGTSSRLCVCVEYLQFSVETVQRQFNLADRAMKLVPEQTGLHTAKLLWLKVLPKNRLGLAKAYSKCYLLILPVLSILKTKDY